MRTSEPSTARLVALFAVALLAVLLGAHALATTAPLPLPQPRGDVSLRTRAPILFLFQ
jgi:hypothetical protein